MARFKDFGKGAESSSEPVTFKLHDETFTCVSAIPGKLMLQIIDNTQQEGMSFDQIETFFSVVMTGDSKERFDALIVDKERIVSMETLGGVVGWLISEYSGLPEEEPETSEAGQ